MCTIKIGKDLGSQYLVQAGLRGYESSLVEETLMDPLVPKLELEPSRLRAMSA